MTDRPDALEPIRRMPAVFGPLPGPRNVPSEREELRYAGRATRIGVSAVTDPEALAELLPPHCELHGDPLLHVAYIRYSELGWLAGRGYNVVAVSISVTYRGKDDTVQGRFVAVAWESLADPVITGRDELGYPKLWAGIDDPAVRGAHWSCAADWLGFRFFELELTASEASAPAPAAQAPSTLVYKYVPRSGRLEEGDVDQVVAWPASPRTVVQQRLAGTGRFQFHAARWEDMPTQYPITQALAALPLIEFRDGFVEHSTGMDAGSKLRVLS